MSFFLDQVRMLFRKPVLQVPKRPVGKIELFSRHCIVSTISQHKTRLKGFSREACFENLMDTIDATKVNVTCFLDIAKGPKSSHFLHHETRCPIVEVAAGSEAGSFLRLLALVEALPFDPETILYFVEDDYLHRPGWIEPMLEAFMLPGVEYVTLYDHRDKYVWPIYRQLESRLFVTPSCHWRTTPSTTNTFAMRFKTLMRDIAIHRRFSEKRLISADHRKFCELRRRGALLVSSIPGWSTHVEAEFASPCFAWETLMKQKLFS